MSDKNKHFEQSFYSEKAAGYIIYSQLAIAVGYGYKVGITNPIVIKGLNTATTSLATTVVSKEVMENILLKDEMFLLNVQSGLLSVRSYNKGKERDEYYLLSEEGVKEVMSQQNIIIKDDIEEKDIVLAKEKNKQPTTAKLEVIVAGDRLDNVKKK